MTRRRSWLAWLLNLPPRPLATRLTAAEAAAIAAATPAVLELRQPLSIASAHEAQDRVVWTVGSGGVGAQWWVEVDDATGEVGPVKHFLGR